MSLVGFCSPCLSGRSCLVAPSYIFRHFLPSSEPRVHSLRQWYIVRVIGIPKLLPPKWNCDLQNYALQSSRQSPSTYLRPPNWVTQFSEFVEEPFYLRKLRSNTVIFCFRIIMDQSDIENNGGSETDEAAEICIEVAPPTKQKNEKL